MSEPPGSEYLRWAKTAPVARYDLTSSGVPYVSFDELGAPADQMELSGTGAYGWEPLQRVMAGLYGVPVECCVAAMGCSMANHLAMAAVLRPGDEVLIEHPTYEPLVAVARYLGATVRHFRRDPPDFRIDAARVAAEIGSRTRLVVITNLHNPSSALATESELRAVGDAARSAGARVLVDEVYLDAAADASPRTAFHLGPEFIATSSLTKVFGLNGLRCGWIFAEPELAFRMWRLTELFNNIGVHAAEQLSLAAIHALPRLHGRSREILELNREALNRFYASRPELEAMEHRAGTVSFPRLRDGEVDVLVEVLRRRYETAVVPGGFFGMSDHFRIGLGVRPEDFAEGLARLGSALGEM